MRPGIGQNASCALGDCSTSRPEGCSWPRELWFSIYSCTILMCYLYSYLVVMVMVGHGEVLDEIGMPHSLLEVAL